MYDAYAMLNTNEEHTFVGPQSHTSLSSRIPFPQVGSMLFTAAFGGDVGDVDG